VNPSKNPPHRIRRRTLELRVGHPAAVEKWRSHSRGLWEEALAPALEEALDDFSPADGRVWRIPRVEVEVHLNAETPWAEVEVRFAALLREQLAALRGTSAVHLAHRDSGNDASESKVSRTGRAREWIAHWLRTGTLPWWAGSPNATDTAEALLEVLLSDSDGHSVGWLAALVNTHPAAAYRLGHHLPREFQVQLLRAAAARSDTADVPVLLAEWLRSWNTEKNLQGAEPVIWAATWLVWARQSAIPRTWPAIVERLARAIGAASPATLYEMLRSNVEAGAPVPPHESCAGTKLPTKSRETAAPSDPTVAKTITRNKKQNEPDAKSPAPDAIAGEASVFTVNNAGLVLLAPFFAPLFSALGCDQVLRRRTGDEQPTTFSPEAGRLVGLLHYISTGAMESFEPELLLPKLLCGLPPEWPVPAIFEPTELEQTEVTKLLASVIAHWTALGQTTPEGLRSSFLNRSGTLTLLENGWQLRVEKRGWDVLVQRIPWTFGLVKFSWMPQPILAEWN